MNNSCAHQLIKTFLQHLDSLPDRWERKRIQSPQTVFCTLLILALGRGTTSTRRALSLLSELFPNRFRRKEPSPQAFSKARKKLSEDMLKESYWHLRENLDKGIDRKEYLVNGLLPVAIDGSQINAPRSASTIKEFGLYASRHTAHQPQSRLIVAWDIFGRRPIDWITGTCYESERSAAQEMITKLPQNSLVLLDRGFHGIDTFSAFAIENIACFMRVRGGKTTWMPVKNFISSGKLDDEIYLTDIKESRKIKCRIIRFKPKKSRNKNSKDYIFITNLFDKKKWPRSLLVQMYRARWDIETAYREMKINDQIEGFNSRHADGIKQEITAYMMARLLVGHAMRSALSHIKIRFRWKDQTRHLTNYVTLADGLIDTILDLIRFGAAEAELTWSHALIIIEDALQKRRPNRSYERKCRGRYGRWKGTKNHRKKAMVKS